MQSASLTKKAPEEAQEVPRHDKWRSLSCNLDLELQTRFSETKPSEQRGNSGIFWGSYPEKFWFRNSAVRRHGLGCQAADMLVLIGS